MRQWNLSFFITIFYLFFCTQLHAKPPQLTQRDTRVKIEEILKAHVSHQQLNEELVIRAIQNFVEELDPSKTYFLESDIHKWLDPERELTLATLEGYRKEDFFTFESIHAKMVDAIVRRNELEKEIEQLDLPKDVK